MIEFAVNLSIDAELALRSHVYAVACDRPSASSQAVAERSRFRCWVIASDYQIFEELAQE